MWKIKRQAKGPGVTLQISGRIEGQHLAELRKILVAEAGDQQLILDMQEVRLVDQSAVTFLIDCEAHGAMLPNCPPYIREWMEREKQSAGRN